MSMETKKAQNVRKGCVFSVLEHERLHTILLRSTQGYSVQRSMSSPLS